MEFIDNYDKTKNPQSIKVRPITLEEVKNLRYGETVKALLNNGKLGNVRVISQVKRWKRNPNRVQVSFAYGLYEKVRMEFPEMQGKIFIELED